MAAAQAPAKEPKSCERPGCPVRFIPRAVTHKFCSSKCKQRVVAYKYALNGGGRLWPAGGKRTATHAAVSTMPGGPGASSGRRTSPAPKDRTTRLRPPRRPRHGSRDGAEAHGYQSR